MGPIENRPQSLKVTASISVSFRFDMNVQWGPELIISERGYSVETVGNGWAALEQSRKMVDLCVSETRTLSHLLHPPLLDENGLASAVRWYVEGLGTAAESKSR